MTKASVERGEFRKFSGGEKKMRVDGVSKEIHQYE